MPKPPHWRHFVAVTLTDRLCAAVITMTDGPNRILLPLQFVHLTLVAKIILIEICKSVSGLEHGIQISDIPDICHGSHGYIRVNFFWTV